MPKLNRVRGVIALWLVCSAAPAQESGAADATPAFQASEDFEQVRAEADSDESGHGVVGMGLPPSMPEAGGEAGDDLGRAKAGAGGFDFHGYLRVPMRIGLGPRHDEQDGDELHAPARVPDLSFTNWNYIHNHPGAWADLVFSYTAGRATMTASIASRNPTVASFRNLQAQLGINTAFVTLNFPEAFGSRGGLKLDVGAMSNRYGAAGKYNAGMYMTYLFGKTRIAGETLAATIGLNRDLELNLEHGVGAKLDVIPFSADPDRQAFEPYAGPEPQGSTFVHHAHAGVSFKDLLHFGTHYISTWSTDDRNAPGIDGVVPPSEPGRLDVYGADLRLTGEVYGYGYLGYSRARAQDILSIADSLELLHSQSGWQFRNNYFGRFDSRDDDPTPGDPNGVVDSLMFQYEFSFGKLARHPARFWGNGPDLTLTLFGMYNNVTDSNNDHQKFKTGSELLYKATKHWSFGARYDIVQPDLNNSHESYSVVTPQVVLRTDFTSHERVTFKYSRYFFGPEVRPAFPYDDVTQLDPNVFSISGSMWW